MDIVDIMIHVHPDLLPMHREKLEGEMRGLKGIISAHFNHKITHELTMTYDPELLDSKAILMRVKQWDNEAVIIGI